MIAQKYRLMRLLYDVNTLYGEIVKKLETIASTKQQVNRKTHETFGLLKERLSKLKKSLREDIRKKDPNVEITYQEMNDYEVHFSFGGDTLMFFMHTNVFSFPKGHFVHNTDYVKEDPLRGYCGMILVYNFMSDSIKYSRFNDVGTLIGRIFVNKDGKFFVEGRKQLALLFKEFGENTVSEENMDIILNTAVMHALDFDLKAPPSEAVQEITLYQKVQETGQLAIKTGKRVGFEMGFEKNDQPSLSRKK